MKLCKFCLLSIIALGMIACSNDDDPKLGGEKNATISLKVFAESEALDSRATGDLSKTLDAESKIKKLEAWVFANDVLENYSSVDNAMEIKGIKVSSGSRTLVVVANASLGSQSSLATLKKLTKELSQDVSKGLVMTAEPLSLVLKAGENQYGYKKEGNVNNLSESALGLVRINARVALVSAKLDLEKGNKKLFDELKDIQVAMFNVPKNSNLFGDPLALNKDFLYGDKWPTPGGKYDNNATGKTDALLDKPLSLPITDKKAPYYYVNENNAAQENQQMLIVLRGKPFLGNKQIKAEGLYTDKDGYTYYPIWVNADKEGYQYQGKKGDSVIRRNTQYDISLTIKSIGNPSIDETEKAFLDVKVVVTPWDVVRQNVEW